MIQQWVRELGMGARFAATGGRSGWVRTLLTAVGVGLGVAVLLLSASVPSVMSASSAKSEARQEHVFDQDAKKSDHTIKVAYANSEYRDTSIWGRLVQPDGDPAQAVRPPGVDRLPGPDEMVVSPALRDLLDSKSGELLKERFGDARIVGTIGDEGLRGPGELAFYLGSDNLVTTDDGGAYRVASFGASTESEPLDPMLVLLLVVMCVVLLMPIAVFIGTAVRFGSESRDKRLAALRLVGSDIAMTRRIAAGEALFGSLLGLLLGGWFFLLGRMFIGRLTLFGTSVFPSDVTPSWPLATLIVLAVPASAVAVTLFALRGVAISPLGVVRGGADRGRRLWWRLLLLVAGMATLGMLIPDMREVGEVNEWLVASGVILTLLGVTTLLPWLVERVVGRMRGGSLSWQLASRRLQLSSGSAARAVSGVTVAVAGAIALQMLFSAVEVRDRTETGQDPDRAQMMVYDAVSAGAQADETVKRYEDVDGVRSVLGFVEGYGVHENAKPDEEGWYPGISLIVGDCATLAQLAKIKDCSAGDAFYTRSEYDEGPKPKPGDRIDVHAESSQEGMSGKPNLWTVPQTLRLAQPVEDPEGMERTGLLATPEALSVSELRSANVIAMVRLQSGNPDAVEGVRNAAGVDDPATDAIQLVSERGSDEFSAIRNGLLIGAIVIMLLIGASMVISTIEQLRERKRQLSVLVAFGTRRATLGASVLWQTAIPVLLGIGLATVGGTGLGLLLLQMIEGQTATDWLAFLPLAGAGMAVIALVTLASMPSLWRMMRPDGLRTE